VTPTYCDNKPHSHKFETQLTLDQELGLWHWSHPSSIPNTKGFMAILFKEKPFIILLLAL